jgi:DNA-binding response OmpR family regulator
MVARKWQVVSRAELVDYIWWWEVWENDGMLDVYIATIRKKIGKEHIETIKWFGYKIS